MHDSIKSAVETYTFKVGLTAFSFVGMNVALYIGRIYRKIWEAFIVSNKIRSEETTRIWGGATADG